MRPAEQSGSDGGRAFQAGVEWLKGEGQAADVVMSSRARVARNVTGLPFVNKCSTEQRQRVLDLVREAAQASAMGEANERVVWLNVHECAPAERSMLVERHLISKQFSRGKPPSGASSAEDIRGLAVTMSTERVSLMVNEEDHLRLQVLRSGLALAEAWESASGIDDRMQGAMDFAYSSRWGYLTACPTNVGTGVRMSVMLHLPALRMTGDMEKVKRAAGDMNLAVRGFYGEGSEAVGDLYQISNQTTLGKTEATILHELQDEIIPQVIEYERLARKLLLQRQKVELEDAIFRAMAILRNARKMGTEESMQLLSVLRMGVVMGLVTDIPHHAVNAMLLLVQPAHLQRLMSKELDQDARKEARAALLRTRLAPN